VVAAARPALPPVAVLLCGVALVVVGMAGCAGAPPAPVVAAPRPAPAPPPAPPAAEEEPEPPPPSSWDAALEQFAHLCPAPFFTLPVPAERTAAGVTFLVHGSRWTRVGPPQRSLTLGVLGAIKDATPATKANLQRAAREFRKHKVDVVLANGDLVGNTIEAVDLVVGLLANTFSLPVLVHPGNSEWLTRYNEAMAEARQKWPAVIDLNMVRDLDWSGIHLVSLPGYFNRRFLREGACHYDQDDVDALGEWIDALVEQGQTVVLSSHGAPQGSGAHGIDVIYDLVNVGDPALTTLIQESAVPFGIFSHILEAGGRAVDAPDAAAPLALPMKQATPRLYANVGASTSFPWQMLDGKTSRGMAAVFRVDRHDDGTADAKVTFLKLR
jgi:hypothetical protein